MAIKGDSQRLYSKSIMKKVKIFTFVFNRPDILQQQIDCFKKYVEDNFEFNVVYDTRDSEYLQKFREICDKNNVTLYLHQSQPGGSPSFYNSDSIQWTYNNIICADDEDCLVLILDHDIFLIDEFNINKFMEGYDLAGCPQPRGHITYVWQGLLFFRKNSVQKEQFDFYPKQVEGQMLDSCGGTYALVHNPNIRYKKTDVQYPDEYNGINLLDEENSNGFGFELHADGKFLHSRNASNWHNGLRVTDNQKTSVLNTILSDFIE